MKKLLVCLLVLALLMGCTQLTAEQIAEEMKKRYEALQDMSGEFIVTTDFGGKKESYRAKFWMKMPNKYRSEDENTLVVSNGSMMWVYDRVRNEVTKIEINASERPQFDYGAIVEELLESYDVKLLGEEEIGGRSCYVIEAKSKGMALSQKLWVDKEFWYPLRIEMGFENFTSVVEYRNVSFNTGLNDDLFEFTPPEGAKIIEKEFKLPEKLTIEEAQKKVNFTIIKPSYTASYKFDYAMVFNDFVQLYYKKGDNAIVISEREGESKPLPNAEKVKIGNIEGEMAEVFGSRILRFSKNNIDITIAGKLSEEELVKIAESMI
jgi:outer membrane lipoprotein-sorting protein